MTRRISSRTNPFCRHVSRLASDAAYRRDQELYLCDGLTLLGEALASNTPPEDVVAAEGVTLPPLPDAVHLTWLPPDLLRSLSPVEHPQGVLSLCPLPPALSLPPSQGRFIYLERVQDPGNVGSLLRCADAFGWDGVFLSEGCADAFHPKTVRAAMGALFRLPVGRAKPQELGTLPLWAAAPRGEPLGRDSVFPPGLILALGNEGQGLSEELLGLAARSVSIPMHRATESLGVAAAGAILTWFLGSTRIIGETPKARSFSANLR